MLYTTVYLVPELNSQTSTGNSRNPKAVSSGATVHFPSAVICTLATYGRLKSPRCIHKYIWVRSVLQRFVDDSFLHAEGAHSRNDSEHLHQRESKRFLRCHQAAGIATEQHCRTKLCTLSTRSQTTRATKMLRALTQGVSSFSLYKSSRVVLLSVLPPASNCLNSVFKEPECRNGVLRFNDEKIVNNHPQHFTDKITTVAQIKYKKLSRLQKQHQLQIQDIQLLSYPLADSSTGTAAQCYQPAWMARAQSTALHEVGHF
ncbi:hypothetical protein Anapl_13455 [Anas platyrhynchos]|uniref:Uncharacterized protein n=1 Tax=Anas platyrhynchos TaxID=8839 RepID=R0L921_ANAPL|nr:hypothetical protein Anapl_13455 [Anas platyrhynchos]